jgi:hypothetical protein
MHAFRLPQSALLRQYAIFVALFFLAMLIVPDLRGGSALPLGLLALLFASLFLALFMAYLVASRRVWVTLSQEGIRGMGINGRQFTLLWSAPLLLTPVSPPGAGTVAGVTMLAIGGSGRPTGDGVFVPHAIARSPEFVAVVETVAPPEHPLRKAVSHAA